MFVGSGGALASAQFAADLMASRGHQFAIATTPLGLIDLPSETGGQLVVVSARASHPDVALAINIGVEKGLWPIKLITTEIQV